MQIIISGSTGFIGQNLVAYLSSQGENCIALSLRDDDWIKRFSYNSSAVIHLAGKAHDTSNSSDSDEYFTVNRDLTIEVFEHFIKSDAKIFVYFSSVKAASDAPKEILTEDVEPTPATPYGKSKLEAERYILARHLPAEKKVFIVRPCMVHGPGNKGNLNLLVRLVKSKLPWPLARFDNERSFLCIDNLNYLIHEVLRSPNLPSGIYNFADDDTMSTNELVRVIGEVLGINTEFVRIPKWLISAGAGIGDFFKLPLNSDRLRKLTESYVVSNKKIKDGLGISSLPNSTIDGVKKTVKAFELN